MAFLEVDYAGVLGFFQSGVNLMDVSFGKNVDST